MFSEMINRGEFFELVPTISLMVVGQAKLNTQVHGLIAQVKHNLELITRINDD